MAFSEGDFVWAKMKGYPQWPAKVEGIVKSRRKAVEPTKYRIFFYGTHETSVVAEPNLKPYEQFKAKFKRPLQRHGYAEGIWEIEEDPELKMVMGSSTKKRGRPRKTPSEQQVAKRTRHSNDENAPTATPIPSPPTTTPTTSGLTPDTGDGRLTRSASRRASLRSKASAPPKAGSSNIALKQEYCDTSEVLAALTTDVLGDLTSDVLGAITVPMGGGLADITNSVTAQPLANTPKGGGVLCKPLTASPCAAGSNGSVVGGMTPKSGTFRPPGRGGRSSLFVDTPGREAPLSPIVVTPPMRRPLESIAEEPQTIREVEVEAMNTTSEAPLDMYAPTEHPPKPLDVVCSTAQDPQHMDTSQPPDQAAAEVCPTAPALGDIPATVVPQASAEVTEGGVSSTKHDGEGLMTEEATIDIAAFKEQQLTPVSMETNDPVKSVRGAPHNPPHDATNPQSEALQLIQPQTGATKATSQPSNGPKQTEAGGDTIQDGRDAPEPIAPEELVSSSDSTQQTQTVPTNSDKDNDHPSLSNATAVEDGAPPVAPKDRKGKKGVKVKVAAMPRPAIVGRPLGAGPHVVGKVGGIAGRGKGKQKKCESNEVKHLSPPKTATTVELLTTLNYNIKCALRRGQPNMYRAMRHLNDLHYLEVDSETLNKVPDIVRTIRKLRHYKGNKKVEKKAAEILTKFKGLFVVAVRRPNEGKAVGSSKEKAITALASSSNTKGSSLLDLAEEPHSASNTTADGTEAQGSPCDEDTTPTQVDTTPTQVETTPTQMETTPTQMETTPTQVETTPTQMEITPTQMETTPTQIGTTPTQMETTPIRVEATPTQVEGTSTKMAATTQLETTPTQTVATTSSAGECEDLHCDTSTTADEAKVDTPHEYNQDTTTIEDLGQVEDRHSANTSTVDVTKVDTPTTSPHEGDQDKRWDTTTTSTGEVKGLDSADNTTTGVTTADGLCSPPCETNQENEAEDVTVTALPMKKILDVSVDGHLTMQEEAEMMVGGADEVDQMVP